MMIFCLVFYYVEEVFQIEKGKKLSLAKWKMMSDDIFFMDNRWILLNGFNVQLREKLKDFFLEKRDVSLADIKVLQNIFRNS